MDLFKINPKTGLVTINIEVQALATFRAWIRSDKDQRKTKTTREATYMYNMHHYSSIFRTAEDHEKHTECLEESGLPKNWKPSPTYKAAEEFFIKKQAQDEKILLLMSMRKALMGGQRLQSAIGNQLDDSVKEFARSRSGVVDEPNREDFEEEGKYEQALKTARSKAIYEDEKRERLLRSSLGYLRDILKLAREIPDAIKAITELEEQVKKGGEGGMHIRGGGSVGMFEEPDD